MVNKSKFLKGKSRARVVVYKHKLFGSPKSKRFRIGLLIYLGVLAAICAALLIILWNALADSQAEFDRQAEELAAQQAHEEAIRRAPQLAFEAWQSRLNADYWTELWYEQSASDLDPREQVYTYMVERFAADAVKAYKSTDFTEAVPVYVLKNGDETLARITLSGSELNWSVSKVELMITGTKSATVLAADGFHVFCNGQELGSEYAGESVSFFRYTPLADQLVNPVTWTEYTVDNLLLEPELTAEAPDGYSFDRTPEGDHLLYLEGDISAYTEKSIAFVRAYLYYYMCGSFNTHENLANVLSYLTPGTQAYRNLNNSYDGVSWNNARSNIDTSKTYANDVIVWADNCYSVDVTYDADCTFRGVHEDYADATMRIYFLKTNSGFIINNFEIL